MCCSCVAASSVWQGGVSGRLHTAESVVAGGGSGTGGSKKSWNVAEWRGPIQAHLELLR